MIPYSGLLWLIVFLGPLLVLQRSLHHEIRAILFILTRREDIALALFSIIFFPGILLHEGSHYLTARVLRVRTGRFSLLPHLLQGGGLQLGFVETAPTDWLRDAIIGAAPFFAGGLFVAYVGYSRLGFPELVVQVSSGNIDYILHGFSVFYSQPDFWLWFYLTFTISSTMFPSSSDRRAWLPLSLVVGVLLFMSLLAGAGPWMIENIAPQLNQLLLEVAWIFGMSSFVHLILLIPTFGFLRLLIWLKCIKVE